MKKLMAIIRREYIERVKTKGFVLSTILIPLLMSLTIVIPMLTEKSEDTERTMAVIDVDGKWLPGLMAVAASDTTMKIILEPVPDDLGDLETRIQELKRQVGEGEVYGGIVLEENFQQDPKLSFYVNPCRRASPADRCGRRSTPCSSRPAWTNVGSSPWMRPTSWRA